MDPKKSKTETKTAVIKQVEWLRDMGQPLWCMALSFLATVDHIATLKTCKAMKHIAELRQSWSPSLAITDVGEQEQTLFELLKRWNFPPFRAIEIHDRALSVFLADNVQTKLQDLQELRLFRCEVPCSVHMPSLASVTFLCLEACECECENCEDTCCETWSGLVRFEAVECDAEVFFGMGELPALRHVSIDDVNAGERLVQLWSEATSSADWKVESVKLANIYRESAGSSVLQHSPQLTSLSLDGCTFNHYDVWHFFGQSSKEQFLSVTQLSLVGFATRNNYQAKHSDDDFDGLYNQTGAWDFFDAFPNLEVLDASHMTEKELLDVVPSGTKLPALKTLYTKAPKAKQDNPFACAQIVYK